MRVACCARRRLRGVIPRTAAFVSQRKSLWSNTSSLSDAFGELGRCGKTLELISRAVIGEGGEWILSTNPPAGFGPGNSWVRSTLAVVGSPGRGDSTGRSFDTASGISGKTGEREKLNHERPNCVREGLTVSAKRDDAENVNVHEGRLTAKNAGRWVREELAVSAP